MKVKYDSNLLLVLYFTAVKARTIRNKARFSFFILFAELTQFLLLLYAAAVYTRVYYTISCGFFCFVYTVLYDARAVKNGQTDNDVNTIVWCSFNCSFVVDNEQQCVFAIKTVLSVSFYGVTSLIRMCGLISRKRDSVRNFSI